MKVTYTEEQRKHAIKTFKRLKSYAKTINVLGYPSRHTLHDWVNKRSHKKPSTAMAGFLNLCAMKRHDLTWKMFITRYC